MKKVVIFLANGFEEIEALTVVDVLRRAEITCNMCALGEKWVVGSHGIKVEVDLLLSEFNGEAYDCLVLPGGMPGAKNLKENSKIIEIVKTFNDNKKLVAAICAAPIVLKEANIIEGKNITSFPGVKEELIGCNYKEDIVLQQENIITSRGPATSLDFALKLVENLKGIEVADKLREGMLVNFYKSKTINDHEK